MSGSGQRHDRTRTMFKRMKWRLHWGIEYGREKVLRAWTRLIDINKQRLLGMRPKLQVSIERLAEEQGEKEYADERHYWGKGVFRNVQYSAGGNDDKRAPDSTGEPVWNK